MCSVPPVYSCAKPFRGQRDGARDGSAGKKSNAQGDFRSAAGSGRKNRRTLPLLIERATASTLGGGKELAIVEQHIQEKLKSYAAEILPGVDTALAGAIIAELGMDMRVFESGFRVRLLDASLSGQQQSARIGTLLVYEAWPNLFRKMGLSLATVVPDASSRIMTA